MGSHGNILHCDLEMEKSEESTVKYSKEVKMKLEV